MKFKLDHIGYVVKDLNFSIDYYNNIFGLKRITKTINEKAHGVKIVFIELGHRSMPVLELITPTSKKSKVYNFLEKKGDSFHHFAYEVKNINKTIKYLEKKGSMLIDAIVPGAGHNKTKTAWMYTNNKQLIELIEYQKNRKNYNRFTL